MAYTLDGAGAGEVEGETFSADKATVTITGINIHPAIAKDRMLNAVKLAGEFLAKLPQGDAVAGDHRGDAGVRPPVHHRGRRRRGEDSHACSADFETPKLTEYAEMLRRIGTVIESGPPGRRR